MKPKKLIIILFLILLTACQTNVEPTTEPINDLSSMEAQAKVDLITFFEKLNQGQYEDAIALYGGSYEVLQGYNPDVDPQDKATLMKFGCEFNGLTCLQVYDAVIKSQNSNNEFLFEVRYSNKYQLLDPPW